MVMSNGESWYHLQTAWKFYGGIHARVLECLQQQQNRYGCERNTVDPPYRDCKNIDYSTSTLNHFETFNLFSIYFVKWFLKCWSHGFQSQRTRVVRCALVDDVIAYPSAAERSNR